MNMNMNIFDKRFRDFENALDDAVDLHIGYLREQDSEKQRILKALHASKTTLWEELAKGLLL